MTCYYTRCWLTATSSTIIRLGNREEGLTRSMWTAGATFNLLFMDPYTVVNFSMGKAVLEKKVITIIRATFKMSDSLVCPNPTEECQWADIRRSFDSITRTTGFHMSVNRISEPLDFKNAVRVWQLWQCIYVDRIGQALRRGEPGPPPLHTLLRHICPMTLEWQYSVIDWKMKRGRYIQRRHSSS